MRLKYAFINKHSTDYPVRRLCQTLKVHPSGYYAWLAEPQSTRAKEDHRLLGLIKQAWLESGGVYGYRKIHGDLRELGETCGRNRVGRLMQAEGLRSQTGYRRRPAFYGGKPTVASPNHLARQFKVSEPNKVWVTDITYIRTYEGWLYLAVVLPPLRINADFICNKDEAFAIAFRSRHFFGRLATNAKKILQIFRV